MPQSDPLSILLAHDRWATRQIFTACVPLTPEQFHRRFEMGVGSLHDTGTHMLGAMRSWVQMLAGQEVGPRLEKDGQQRTPAQLLELLDPIANDLASQAHRLPLTDTITRTREGKTYTFTRGVVLTHVTTHGMHHRAQCLNMLRHVGVNPLPLSSVIEWSRTTDH